ncbi:MAG TPA: hypothetical protein DCM45_03410 [Clostridiales bacterium]|nr:hypothetical protein [Clostridiales bacterium]
MAFSLEAASIMPCVISCSLSLLLAAPALYQEVWHAASLEVAAAIQAVSGSSLYQTEILSEGELWTTKLQTSPQMMFELASLVLDDGRLLLQQLADISGGQEAGQVMP